MKIAYFAPIYYDYLKQRPQHFAELLAQNHDVIYIEPTISSMKYILKGGKSYKGISYSISERLRVLRVDGTFMVHKSLDLFDIFNLNSVFEYLQLKKIIEECDVIWVGYPGWYKLISRFKNKKVIYDKMDEDSQIATNPLLKRVLKSNEAKLISKSDMIFVSCQKFYDRISPKKKMTFLVPNAVPQDVVTVSDSKTVSNGLSEKKEVVFGYIGTISHWFDFDVVSTILESSPNNKVVLVGNNMMPEVIDERIRYVGAIPKEEVPHKIQEFDVCLYNFKQNELLDTINPVKIYEYLAMNKPVISVRSMETSRFEDKLMLYGNKTELIQLLRNEWKKPFKCKDEIEVFISKNSWEARVENIEQALKNI